jgi:hypothetical protein
VIGVKANPEEIKVEPVAAMSVEVADTKKNVQNILDGRNR